MKELGIEVVKCLKQVIIFIMMEIKVLLSK